MKGTRKGHERDKQMEHKDSSVPRLPLPRIFMPHGISKEGCELSYKHS